MVKKTTTRKELKAGNRQRLILAALELFGQLGYRETTLEAIAERAGFHVQTLYRHFDNKVQLAMAGEEEQLANFKIAIRNPTRTNTTVQFWRDYVGIAAEKAVVADGGQAYRQVLKNYLDTPAISPVLARIGRDYRALLADYLERDLVLTNPADRKEVARLIAITLWGANEHVAASHRRMDGFDLVHEAVAVIDRIEKLYSHVLINDTAKCKDT
ncbi:MAG: TetR family transcriptional regulator [Pseudomonadales bacterium]|nr:TetR family transcriptional regulator [Pseudomonadales bacterium]